jgi:hypothetical protein
MQGEPLEENMRLPCFTLTDHVLSAKSLHVSQQRIAEGSEAAAMFSTWTQSQNLFSTCGYVFCGHRGPHYGPCTFAHGAGFGDGFVTSI